MKSESQFGLEAVEEQLACILRNERFAGSPRMARFLQFTVEECLAGRGSQLKEIIIGMKVFDRSTDYDPRLDPIVRVEARRLRRKLAEYYGAEGENDPIVIEFPKGGYAPTLRERKGEVQEPNSEWEVTVAVLPFLSLDPGLESEYFSDGLSEELLHALTSIQGLGVVAWNSVAQLRHQQDEVSTIRERLGAAYMLRGSIRKTGNRLRITAQLVRTSDSHYIWSEAFDRQVEDVFAIQREIATSIASALNLRLRKGAGADQTAPVLQNLDAYQLCLKARFYARERTMEGLRRSLALHEQAVALDRSSVLAHSGLADTYALIAEYGFADGCDCMEKAKAAAEQALALDPTSAEAHASFALIMTLYDWEWSKADAAFRRSLELNPGYAYAHFWYGADYLANIGRSEEAHRAVEAALRLDPLSTVMHLGNGFLSVLDRDYEKAADIFAKVIKQDSSFYRGHACLARTQILMGRYSQAVESLQRSRVLAGDVPSVLGALGQAHALAGDTREAKRVLDVLLEMLNFRPVPSVAIAVVYMGLGENAEALTWLERGVARHQPSMAGLMIHPNYDPIRGESRYQRLIEIMGFPRPPYRKTTQ